jgi:hypothetical protein
MNPLLEDLGPRPPPRTNQVVARYWFHGHFYPERCDVSPDGTLLIYFAGITDVVLDGVGRETCAHCGRKKYSYSLKGFYPAPVRVAKMARADNAARLSAPRVH